MPFAYYRRLSPSRRRIYDASSAVTSLPLPRPEALRPLVANLREHLADEQRRELESSCRRLTAALLDQLGCAGAEVRVLEARPSRSWGELHGLYEPADESSQARLTVWMRTARKRRPVAFKTFLRTLLHELLHHLDYVHLELDESLHTEGFFQRESSLFHQLCPEER